MILHFPSQGAIVSYLEQHPLTSKETNQYLSEEKIIEAVAKFFGDQDKPEMCVDTGVMLTMYNLNEKLKLSEMVLESITLILTDALKDCANGKKID